MENPRGGVDHAQRSAGSHECVFCGEPADTVEHVIPKWLQEHFDLSNQRLLLWNGTTMPYRQAVVPACLRCNRDRFSPLERRVRECRASRRDYYLWALKIPYFRTPSLTTSAPLSAMPFAELTRLRFGSHLIPSGQ